MTNKDILEQYTAVLAECRILEKELSGLRDKGLEYVTDAVSGCPDYPPYGVRSVQIGGIAQDPRIKREIEQLEDKIKQQYVNAMMWRNRAESILATVESATMRVILRYKCIDGLEWPEIAAKMGPKYTVGGLKMQYKRFLEKF